MKIYDLEIYCMDDCVYLTQDARLDDPVTIKLSFEQIEFVCKLMMEAASKGNQKTGGV